MNKPHPFHTFVFALSPVMFLWSRNELWFPFYQTVVPLLAMLAFGALLLVAFRFMLGGYRKSALFTSAFLVLFFGFASVFMLLGDLLPWFRQRYAMVLLIIVLGLLFWLIKRSKSDFTAVTKVVNVVAAVFLLINLGGIALAQYQNHRNAVDRIVYDMPLTAPAVKPDIYYFILDGYARADMLKTVHRYDNEPFLDALRQRGFYIADSSRSNYSYTIASLASSLNMDYLEKSPEAWLNAWWLRDRLHHNAAFRMLDSLGYTLNTFPTGHEFCEIRDVDRFVSTPYMNEVWMALINSTPLRVLPLMNKVYIPNKRRVALFPYDHLRAHEPEGKPKLVYVHTVLPHPPYMFGPNGEPRDHDFDVWINYDWRLLTPTPYGDQVTFTNKLVLEAVDSIIARSATPPIVVIQGDHGSKRFEDAHALEKNYLAEQFANICAVRFPGPAAQTLYPSITPVNIFRLLFNNYFGANFNLLPDRSYYFTIHQGSPLVDVTEALDAEEAAQRSGMPPDTLRVRNRHVVPRLQ